MVGTLGFQAVRYLNGAGVPPPAGNHHPINAPYGVYHSKDGYITLGATGDKRWPQLCRILGMPNLPNDPRFNTNGGRYANRLELAKILESKLREKTSDEWEIILNQNSIPCGPIYKMDQALEHPQVQHRQMVVEKPHPTMGTVRLLGLPVKLAETPGDVFRVPPLLGEQSDEVLRDIGLSDAEIAGLRQSGIVGERPETHTS
jgi:formyl-CoA transferase